MFCKISKSVCVFQNASRICSFLTNIFAKTFSKQIFLRKFSQRIDIFHENLRKSHVIKIFSKNYSFFELLLVSFALSIRNLRKSKKKFLNFQRGKMSLRFSSHFRKQIFAVIRQRKLSFQPYTLHIVTG